MTDSIYLDHNATTPMRPQAIAAMAEVMAAVGNASSVHAFGRSARAQLDRARTSVADLVGAQAADVVFTGGGTEANNAVLRGAQRQRVIASAIEHDSVRLAADNAETVPVTPDGVIDLEALSRMLAASSEPALVCVMLANNETGVVQPVAEVARMAHAAQALVHCDAVQAAGRIAIDMSALDVDYLTLSAHKLGGPQGVGAVVLRASAPFAASQRGGGQERSRRAGTENVAGIAGFGVAAGIAAQDLPAATALATLRDKMEHDLVQLAPDAQIFGSRTSRLPNTSCVAMPGVAATTQLMALDLAGVAVSAGSACSSGKVKPSHVLAAMGATENEAASALRVSLGWTTTADHVGRFVGAWSDLYRRLSPASRPATAAA
ncbi:MAG TPA: cysteine desulfurase family protein [Vineibacter sp.]|nr:cysteine desulfurase family protein [Vineibacter sp.]